MSYTPTRKAREMYESMGINARSRTAKMSKRRIKEVYDVGERTARTLQGLCRASAVPDDAQVVPGEGPPQNGSYTYQDGQHAFSWEGRHFIFTEEMMQAMIDDYVQDGLNLGMQAVATKHGLLRSDFHKIKSLYGLTKASLPFTNEYVMDTPVEQVSEEGLAKRLQTVSASVEREYDRKIKQLAKQWLDMEAQILDPFEATVVRVLGHCPPPSVPSDIPTNHMQYALWFQPSDLHLGAFADAQHAGRAGAYDRATAIFRCKSAFSAVTSFGRRAYGPPEVLILGVGGDVFHADTDAHTTSSMKNHMDMDGIVDTLFDEGVDLYLWMIDQALEEGIPVRLECVPGNHDRLLSIALCKALAVAYRGDGRVTVGNTVSSHAYILYGDTAIVAHHGDGEKTASDLGANLKGWLSGERKHAFYHYAITGNLHHLASKEDDNCTLLQQPSMAGTDRWHKRNGFDKSRPAAVAYAFSAQEGYLGMQYVGF